MKIQHGLALARADVDARPQDAFAWFNLGSDLTTLAQFTEAAAAYDRARQLGLPWRMLWYQFGPFEAYAALGRWQDVSALAEANLRNAPNLEESVYWLGRAAAARGDLETAAAGFRRALRLNPGFLPAGTALAGLDQAPSGP
jgi:cytochrome c-type biogenesis protein CcmH/NrfG